MRSVLGIIHFGQLTLDPGSIVGWVIAALVAGWLAGKVIRGQGFGCLGDILLGLIGAVVGLFILSYLPLPIVGNLHFFGTLVVAFFGALVLAGIGRLIGGGRKRQVVVVRQPPRPGEH